MQGCLQSVSAQHHCLGSEECKSVNELTALALSHIWPWFVSMCEGVELLWREGRWKILTINTSHRWLLAHSHTLPPSKLETALYSFTSSVTLILKIIKARVWEFLTKCPSETLDSNANRHKLQATTYHKKMWWFKQNNNIVTKKNIFSMNSNVNLNVIPKVENIGHSDLMSLRYRHITADAPSTMLDDPTM